MLYLNTPKKIMHNYRKNIFFNLQLYFLYTRHFFSDIAKLVHKNTNCEKNILNLIIICSE